MREYKTIDDKEYCCYCGLNITISIFRTSEHIKPISKGGTNSPKNKKHVAKGVMR